MLIRAPGKRVRRAKTTAGRNMGKRTLDLIERDRAGIRIEVETESGRNWTDSTALARVRCGQVFAHGTFPGANFGGSTAPAIAAARVWANSLDRNAFEAACRRGTPPRV